MKNGNKVAGFYRSITTGAAFAPLSLVLALGLAPYAQAQSAAADDSSAADASSTAQPLDTIAAVVNDDVIMTSALNARVQQVRQQMEGSNVSSMPSENQLRQQVLDRMILEKIQLQMAQRAGLSVGDDQLDAAIQQVAQRDHMTVAQFRRAVEQQGMSYQAVREQIRREIILSQVQQSSVGSLVRVTDAEVDQFMENANQQAGVQFHVAHILVPLPSDPSDSQVAKARQEIQAIRSQVVNHNDFEALATKSDSNPNGVQGSDLGWRAQNDLPTLFTSQVANMNVGDVSQPIRSASGFHLIKLIGRRGGPQATTVEQFRARHILIGTNPIRNSQQAYELAQNLRNKLQHGACFAELASQYSTDYGSALQGGELGWLNEGETVPAFNQYLEKGPVGQVSPPIQTQFGWHLIEVEGRRQENVTVQSERQQARQIIFEHKAEDALQTWLQQIRSQAYVDNRLYPNDNGVSAINASMAPQQSGSAQEGQ